MENQRDKSPELPAELRPVSHFCIDRVPVEPLPLGSSADFHRRPSVLSVGDAERAALSPASGFGSGLAAEASAPSAPSAPIEPGERSTRSGHRLDLGGLMFFLGAASLMLSLWFVGPKLVEQYYYAAAMGRTRALYDHASQALEHDPLRNVSMAYQLVAQKVRPSVVSINAIRSSRRNGGLGSGVIMSEEGYIITNAHVVEEATRFFVELFDRRSYRAQLVGTDKASDLALLKIDAPNLIAAEWGDSDLVEVGAIVWAVGSPFGFQQTVTSGILSGKDRPGEGGNRKKAMLQTDAAVNPGNSGGPLVDAQGKVIGINTSIFGETFQGISFAVPSSTVNFVYQQLKENGKVTRGYLGVAPEQVSFLDAQRFELPDLNGAKLSYVWPRSPAHRAGFRTNDIIRSWNGFEIKEYKNLFQLAEMTPPNATVEVTLLRDGVEIQTKVTLGESPDN
jgi:serine protease Do